MDNHWPLDATFGALSDSTRRSVVGQLAHLGEVSVTDLARGHDMSLSAFLKHLRVLERAELLTTRKEGRTRFCRLAALPLAEAERWIQTHRAFWEGQLTALDRFLRDENAHLDPDRSLE